MDNVEEMDKFLEKNNFPKLDQEEIENLNRPITSTEIETAIKNLPTNKIPGPDVFTGEFCQKFREGLAPILLKLFQKTTAYDPAIPLSILAHCLLFDSLKYIVTNILNYVSNNSNISKYGTHPCCVFCYC